MTISNSFTVGSSWNLSTRFGTHFQKFSPLTITKTCQAERNSFWIVAFSFPVETRTDSPLDRHEIGAPGLELISEHFHRWELRKTIVNFLYMVRDSFPHIFIIGICKITSVEGEIFIVHRQWNGGFNPFSSFLTFRNPIRAIRGKTWGISRNR